jgi:hypothetical protein
MTDNSVILYTNLFTLKGKSVSQNKYVEMYYIWLFYIIKYASLYRNDQVITLIDTETYKYIKDKNTFCILQSKISNFKVIEYEQPTTIKAGIIHRYYIEKIISNTINESYYMYLDIDVLLINDIHKVFKKYNIKENKTTLFLQPEENILGSNYYGELASDEDKAKIKQICPNLPGFSSGIYAWKNNSNIHNFFNMIIKKANENSKELYTVEQPFFNAAIFHYMFKEQGKIYFNIFDSKLVDTNQYAFNLHPDTVLLNFCGIPGDDNFHWDKMFTQLLINAF